jgi:hypothetical protein
VDQIGQRKEGGKESEGMKCWENVKKYMLKVKRLIGIWGESYFDFCEVKSGLNVKGHGESSEISEVLEKLQR